MTMDDGTVYEFTIPKYALTEDEWCEHIAAGMEPVYPEGWSE
jgi:hypothetical protein